MMQAHKLSRSPSSVHGAPICLAQHKMCTPHLQVLLHQFSPNTNPSTQCPATWLIVYCIALHLHVFPPLIFAAFACRFCCLKGELDTIDRWLHETFITPHTNKQACHKLATVEGAAGHSLMCSITHLYVCACMSSTYWWEGRTSDFKNVPGSDAS